MVKAAGIEPPSETKNERKQGEYSDPAVLDDAHFPARSGMQSTSMPHGIDSVLELADRLYLEQGSALNHPLI